MILESRAVLHVCGQDAEIFLQGLLTNDVRQEKFFTCMLTGNGRFLFDMFCYKVEDGYLIDIVKDWADLLFQKLSFYRLKSKVEILKRDDLCVLVDYSFWECFKNGTIFRQISSNFGFEKIDEDKFHYERVKNLMCDGFCDLKQESSVILEFGYDELGAISYNKGCYVGQELIARTKHQGLVRKSVINLKIEVDRVCKKDDKVFNAKTDQEVGRVLFTCKDLALCLVKNELFEDILDLCL